MNEQDEIKAKNSIELVLKELDRATTKFGPFKNYHEGYAVLLEEVDELWAEIKTKRSSEDKRRNIKHEAMQVAAMAIRIMIDLT